MKNEDKDIKKGVLKGLIFINDNIQQIIFICLDCEEYIFILVVDIF